MNYAPWRRAYKHALKTNGDEDWRLADQLLIELSSRCPRSIRDIHKLLTLARIRSGYDPENPGIDGDPSEVWVHHIVAQTCNRLRGTEAIYSSPTSPPIIMHAIDADGRLLFVTEAWCKVMGYHPEEVLGTRSIDLLTDASQRLAFEHHYPMIEEQGPAGAVAYDFISKSGKVIPTSIAATIERDEGGRRLRTIANIQII